MNNIKLYINILLLILISSCQSNDKKSIKENNTKSDNANNKIVTMVNNENFNIGTVYMIYISYDYWDGSGNLTFGVNDKTIDSCFEIMFPPKKESLIPLRHGLIPFKNYLTQNALNYLSEYMTDNCNNVLYEHDYENHNTIYSISLYGKDGLVKCIYADPNKVIEYFNGMINWMKKYHDQNIFNEVIPNLEWWTASARKKLENN